MLRRALAWQPDLTYGNCLTVIINNPKKKIKLIAHARHCQGSAQETEGKHIHTQTETVCHVHMHTQTHTHKDRCTHADAYWLNRKTRS